MAETSGFFDAEELTDGTFDREYVAEQFANYFKLFVGNGVFSSPTNQLKVVSYTGMNVKVSVGWAFINGYWYHNDTELVVPIPANVTSSPVVDGIFLQFNATDRTIRVVLGEGRTTVDRVLPNYELKLAEVSVSTGATSITEANITDTRSNSAVCGFVTGIINVIDSTDLFSQYQAIFDTWFEHMEGQLSEDAAGHLQLEIDHLSGLAGIPEEYNPEQTYSAGQYCLHENVLQCCKANNTTGDWDASKWRATTVMEEGNYATRIVNDNMTYASAGTDKQPVYLSGGKLYSTGKNIIAYTPKKIDRFSSYTLTTNWTFWDIAWNGSDTYVACWSHYLYRGSAPHSLSQVYAAEAYYITDVLYGKGIFLAFVSNERNFLVSFDKGKTWKWKSYTNTAERFGGAAYGDGVFLITTNEATYVSDDGAKWVRTAKPAELTRSDEVLYSVAYGNGKFIIEARKYPGQYSNVYGKVYTYYPRTNTYELTTISLPCFSHIAYGNGIWVAIGIPYRNGSYTSYDESKLYVSTDGGLTFTDTTPVGASPFAKASYRYNSRLQFINSVFVKSTGNNCFCVSEDGINWTEYVRSGEEKADGNVQVIGGDGDNVYECCGDGRIDYNYAGYGYCAEAVDLNTYSKYLRGKLKGEHHGNI